MNFDTKISVESINDLQDKYFDGLSLTNQEKLALANFDQFRIQKLNATQSDTEFNFVYLQIRSMANLYSFEFFLGSHLKA